MPFLFGHLPEIFPSKDLNFTIPFTFARGGGGGGVWMTSNANKYHVNQVTHVTAGMSTDSCYLVTFIS